MTSAQAEPSIAELFSLRGRVALVTGGATGLGLSIAHAPAEAGATTVLASRGEDSCRAGAQGGAARAGAESVGSRIDVADEASVEAAFDGVVERFGAVDVLV